MPSLSQYNAYIISKTSIKGSLSSWLRRIILILLTSLLFMAHMLFLDFSKGKPHFWWLFLTCGYFWLPLLASFQFFVNKSMWVPQGWPNCPGAVCAAAGWVVLFLALFWSNASINMASGPISLFGSHISVGSSWAYCQLNTSVSFTTAVVKSYHPWSYFCAFCF